MGSIELASIILSAVTGSGITAIILAIMQRKWAKDDKQDAVAEGCISLSDKETIKDMHSAYKALGGNGHLNTIMEEVEDLPLRKE